jgi:murein DD-endopeptidase MepM/ murein hydrolase activator NlpD
MPFTLRRILVGWALLTTAGVGSVTTPASADQSAASPDDLAFSRFAAVADGMAAELADQARVQQEAAEAAKARAVADARARKERAEQRSRTARAAARRAVLTTWVEPVGSGISTAYGAGSGRWSSGHHTGVDFTASTGTAVRSVGPGTVVEAGWDGSYGNDVVVRMSDGMYVLYGHLSSVGVSVGQTLVPGQQLAVSGATGNVTGPHLHFEVRTMPDYGTDVDPVAYLRRHDVSV